MFGRVWASFLCFRRFIRAAAGATALAVEQSHFRVLLARKDQQQWAKWRKQWRLTHRSTFKLTKLICLSMKCMKTFRKHILQEGAGPEAFEFLRKMENHCLTKMVDASTTQARISDFLN